MYCVPVCNVYVSIHVYDCLTVRSCTDMHHGFAEIVPFSGLLSTRDLTQDKTHLGRVLLWWYDWYLSRRSSKVVFHRSKHVGHRAAGQPH